MLTLSEVNGVTILACSDCKHSMQIESWQKVAHKCAVTKQTETYVPEDFDQETYNERIKQYLASRRSRPVESVMRQPVTRPPRAVRKPMGLGDRVEQALTAVGITKERYQEVKEAIGLPPGCDCEIRKQWLNRLGERLGDAARNAAEAIFPKKEVKLEAKPCCGKKKGPISPRE